jgi:hypothetical protein
MTIVKFWFTVTLELMSVWFILSQNNKIIRTGFLKTYMNAFSVYKASLLTKTSLLCICSFCFCSAWSWELAEIGWMAAGFTVVWMFNSHSEFSPSLIQHVKSGAWSQDGVFESPGRQHDCLSVKLNVKYRRSLPLFNFPCNKDEQWL